ncbi:unnamed protein product, partial [Scytosiphon promiscuus]
MNGPPAKKRFRLDMDLGGSDSDSCSEEDGLRRDVGGGVMRGRGKEGSRSNDTILAARHKLSVAGGSGQKRARAWNQWRSGIDGIHDGENISNNSMSRNRSGGGPGLRYLDDGDADSASCGRNQEDTTKGRGVPKNQSDDRRRKSRSQPPLVTPEQTESVHPSGAPGRRPENRAPFIARNPYHPSPVPPGAGGAAAAASAPASMRSGNAFASSSSSVMGSPLRAKSGVGGIGGGGVDVGGMGNGASSVRQMPSIVAVQDVYPPELSRIWPFQKFNSIQSALYQTVAKTDRNIVVSAPTGCGKTVVLEMAIARLLHESAMSLGNRKIIYVSPIKALCQQTLDDWTAKFAPLGIRLAELTSDSKGSLVSLRDLASADIILTTPEKWDSVTRRWKEHAFLVGTVALVLVDEVHTIGEERGATLEVILARMKMVSRSTEVVSMGLPASRMRFIALSATLSNAGDFGAFLGAEVFRFGEEFRPVALKTHVVGYACGSNPFLFDRGLNKHVVGIVASLAVLVATTTLAMGVNLPARLVIVKGTNQYRGTKGYQELPKSAILQMMGRAGRPGFDSSGVAVVMTNKRALERLSTGQDAVESSLQSRLLEALNSELREAGVIAMDEDDFTVRPTPHGVLFSRFMVRFDSMKALMSVSEQHSTREVLRACAECHELSVPVRRAEKRLLNDLNKQVRYPPAKKEIVRTSADKALVLLQAALGGLPLEDWTLRGEQTTMLEASARLLGCCAESLAVAGRGGGLGCAVSLRLMRSVRLKMWMDTELGQLRQLPGIGDTMSVRLAGSGIVTLLDLARASSARVDTVAGRKHPFGTGMRHAALQLLSRCLTASISRQRTESGRDELQVRIELAFQSTDPLTDGYIEAPDDAHAPPPMGWRRHDTNFQLLVYYDPSNPTSACEGSSSPLLLFRKVTGEGLHSATLPSEAVEDDLTIHLWLICSGICGMDVADVRVKPSSLDDRFASVEELRGIWSHDRRTSSHRNDGDTDRESAGPSPEAPGFPDPRPQLWYSHNSECYDAIVQVDEDADDSCTSAGNRSGCRGGGRRKGKSKVKGGVGIGTDRASDGGRQLDLPSSFKAGAKRALSDSARQEKPRQGGGGSATASTNEARHLSGGNMSRGELGAIGVSEAGDDLGMSPGSGGLSSKRKASKGVSDTASTASRHEHEPQQQPRNAGRTWNSKSRGSGNVSSNDIGTYNPGGRAMRTVLRQKGSEMKLSSRVGVDRLGRNGGGVHASSAPPGTPSHAGGWLATASPSSTPSSRTSSSGRQGGDARFLPSDVVEGGGGSAVVDLFPRSYRTVPESPAEQAGCPTVSQPRVSKETQSWGRPAGWSEGARMHRPPDAVMGYSSCAAVGTTSAWSSSGRAALPPPRRSWDDLARQRGAGRHGATGIGRAATGERSGDGWSAGPGGDKSEANLAYAGIDSGGFDAGMVSHSSLKTSRVGGEVGGATELGRSGGWAGWKGGAQASGFFGGGDQGRS